MLEGIKVDKDANLEPITPTSEEHSQTEQPTQVPRLKLTRNQRVMEDGPTHLFQHKVI